MSMCEICRQVHCPPGCPNAPLDDRPRCECCGQDAVGVFCGEALCSRHLNRAAFRAAETEDRNEFVQDHWQQFCGYLRIMGGTEFLSSQEYDVAGPITDFCENFLTETYFHWLCNHGQFEYETI